MAQATRPITILVAEDDEDDRLLTREAFAESRVASELRFVADGEELMEYLQQRGRYAAPGSAPRPDLVLLDLNMPRKHGREALRDLKADPRLRQIPVVVLTTSCADEDALDSHALGASSCIPKPVTFEGLLEVLHSLARYWGEGDGLEGR